MAVHNKSGFEARGFEFAADIRFRILEAFDEQGQRKHWRRLKRYVHAALSPEQSNPNRDEVLNWLHRDLGARIPVRDNDRYEFLKGFYAAFREEVAEL